MLAKDLAEILMKNPDHRVVMFVQDSRSMTRVVRDVTATDVYRHETPPISLVGMSVGESMNSKIKWDADKQIRLIG